MTEERMFRILNKYLQKPELIAHARTMAQVLGGVAEALDVENKSLWVQSGLLHDLDIDIVDYDISPELHGLKAVEILKDECLGDEELYYAVAAHNPLTGVAITKALHRALVVAEGLLHGQENSIQTENVIEVILSVLAKEV
jgi:predicted hydrolase (HD superfamily)